MRLLLAALCLNCAAAAGPAIDASDIVGTWEVDNKKDIVHIEITRSDDAFEGKIVWIKNATFPLDDPRGMGGSPKVDRNNPDPALRSRPIVGVAVLGDLRYQGGGEWNSGWIYAPDRGRRARCKAKLTAPDSLSVRGFIGHPIFGSSMVWQRVKGD